MREPKVKELQIHVERIVRPVQALDDTKLKMRNELHAHLEGIYQQELALRGTEGAALAEAKRRIGDPAELTRELQASVPAFERIYACLFGYRWARRESWLRYAGRMSLAVISLTVLLLLTLRGTISVIHGAPVLGVLYSPETWAVLALVVTVMPVGIFLVTGMWTSWHGVFHVRRSRRRALAYSAALALGAWLAGPAFGLWLSEGFSTSMIWALLIMLTLASALPLLIALATNPLGKRLQRCQEWERLEISD